MDEKLTQVSLVDLAVAVAILATQLAFVMVACKICKLKIRYRKLFAIYRANIERQRLSDKIVARKLSRLIRLIRKGAARVPTIIDELTFLRNTLSERPEDVEEEKYEEIEEEEEELDDNDDDDNDDESKDDVIINIDS